jgi:hypothetical protein
VLLPKDADERERSHPSEEVVMAMRQTAPEAAPRSSKATWGLVCGVVAAISAIPFVPGPYFEYLFGAGAIALGALGVQETSHGQRGKGMAVSAIVLGALVIVYKLAVQGW